jgi:hypothetical protein
VINSMRQIQIARGIAPAQAYNQTMYLLGAVLVLGFISNLLVRPVTSRHFRAARVETLSTSHNAAGGTP